MVGMTVSHDERVFTTHDLAALPRLTGEASREIVDGRIVVRHRGSGFSHRDLEGMPEIDGAKHELLDGVIVVSPPGPLNRHEGVLGSLYRLMYAACPPDHRVRFSVFDVRLVRGTVTIKPDLLVAHRDSITEPGVEGPPVLAVEILSRSTRSNDLGEKRALLERAGCPSYWLIDPGRGEIGPTLTVLELVDGTYAEVTQVAGSQSWTAVRPFPVTIIPDDLVDD